MPESAGVPEAREKVERLSRAGLRSKGQVRFPDEEAVLDLRSDRRRNPVAKAFGGSNPTPRTNGTTRCSSRGDNKPRMESEEGRLSREHNQKQSSGTERT